MVSSAFELYQEQLAATLDAEQVLRDALVQLSTQARDEDLAILLRDHAEQALVHADRLEQAFALAELPVARRPSLTMKSVIEELSSFLGTHRPAPDIADVAAAVAALTAEHAALAR